ncbi:chromosome segregation protein SMC [Leptotrichia sp. oral taxon 223]|uniref:chromosome segregation protein SMC n=1 Tax=Leptotrichia sp. oral taxon 223 TaxID=712363 RepID=UPI0015C01C7F|nr:chromosome segregation protein SMC [Leptotrichia sp. oral taxon 223]NWO18349.1 chromosome segregation protein SMC [Leptotrichia sp. oral taxon 223]
MYLKALELTGFKSFANRTVVEFDNGITSIVGPNGSGKSNILDAILWVLGEQSYKNIRAKESSDIIFSGGKNKKPKSMAEVSLIIDNGNRYLDVDFSEVKITRRIFKTGENEYLINNKKSRLKDIHNLFMDTGIGKQAYSIIGQGRVERIIGSSPKELKEIIEEAAGVKRAKIEKEDSEKKLQDLKNEIEKIDYVEKDLKLRVDYLKDEQAKARLFKEYTKKIDVQRFMVLEYNVNEKSSLKYEYEEKSQEIQEELEKSEKNFSEKQVELQRTNEIREELYKNLESQKNENSENFKNLETLKDEYSKLVNQNSNLETEANEKAKRKDILEKDIADKEEILNKSRNELELITKDLIEKEKEKAEWEAKVGELKQKSDKITLELRERTQKNSNFEVDKIKVAGENEDLGKRVLAAKTENKRRIAEKSIVEAEFNKINEEKQTFEIQKSENEKQKLEKELKIQKLNEKTEELRKEYSGINKQKNEISYKLQNFEVKQKAISDAIEKNETFNRSIKHILNEKIDGVIGAFVNLIDVPAGFEEAIQTLSGGMFQDIVVKDSEIGKKCIGILKERKLGRASFLPVENIRVSKMNDFLPTIDGILQQNDFKNKMSEEEIQNVISSTKGKNGIIDFARNIVKIDKKFANKNIEKVIQFVYGNSVVVENLEVGTQLLKKGFNDRIVTLEGDIITSRGRMTGGHSFKGKDEILERKKELKHLEGEIEKNKKNFEKFENKLSEIVLEAEKVETERTEAEKLFENFKNEYQVFNENYDDFNIKFSRKQREINTLNYEISENEKFILEKETKIKENLELIQNIEKNIEENNLKIENLNQDLKNFENIDEFIQKLNAADRDYEILKVRTDNNKNRFAEIESDYKKLLSEKVELAEFEKKREMLGNEFSVKISEKRDEIEKNEKLNKNILGEIQKIEKNIHEIEEKERRFIREIKDIEVHVLKYKNDYENIIEKITRNESELEFQMAEFKELESEEILENEEYFEIADEDELMATKRKLAANERSRTGIGAVNLASIEEFEHENERYQNITAQKKDLLESREALLGFIREIEEEVTTKFFVAYEQINKNFQYMCETILNGAKGIIKMTDPENLLTTGLELSVKYKNKPEQTLLLLSGGEKSMLAVSFIMAIFMFKPSPFTFFDEIEAALDEKNTKKIVELLHQFIDKSQFILITHNKETMKGSHRLYGVTMNKEIGETKIVSVDV